MKKLLISLIVLAIVACDVPKGERQVYEVIDKGNNVSSHFNPFHHNNFSIETDYYITFRNVKNGRTFVHKCSNGNEYYNYQKGKKYYCDFIHE